MSQKPRSGKRAMTQLNLKIEPDLIKAVDEWRRLEEDLPNRSEAVRRLLQQALQGAKGKPKK